MYEKKRLTICLITDLPHRSNAADMAWTLLQKLVVDNEAKDSTLIRKSVVQRLLGLNAFLPQWLINSYKLSHSRELLHLLVKHNRLLEAADLGCEIIAGMLGAGSEYFEFKHAVNIANPQLCFPISTIDLLLHGLKINGKDDLDYEMVSHTYKFRSTQNTFQSYSESIPILGLL